MTNSNEGQNQSNKEVFLPRELPNLLADLSEIYQNRNLVEREYKLVQKANKSDFSLDEYRRMFELYCEIQRQAHWTHYLKQIVQIIQGFAFIGIIVTAVKFYWDTGDRHRKHLFENWDVIALNNTDSHGNIITVNRGRKEALEYLHDQGEDLSKVKAEEAVLNGLNLPGRARLQQSIFKGATLFRAYLSGANLWNVDFQNANLDSANLRGANLQFADFKNADLQKACLRDAKLDHAIFNSKSNLDQVDFRGATGLDLAALQKTNNYKTAIYDERLSLQLGLPAQNVGDNAIEGCRVAPRSRDWWIKS